MYTLALVSSEDIDEIEARRKARARQRRARVWRRRLAAAGSIVAVLAAIAVIALGSSRGGHAGSGKGTSAAAGQGGAGNAPGTTRTAAGTGVPGTESVPVLMYHVVASPPPAAPFPDLYVPADEFTAQMQALKAAGWHAVTLDQLEAYWSRGVALPSGKPIVLTFDNGYHSHYATALPVLRQLGWVGDENIQLMGLPPSQGGLTDDEARGLIAAGWELDTQGISHADLITLNAAQLQNEVATARQILRRRFGVPVNWFCYPSGHYDATVIAAVKSAGYVGSTTATPGWAGPNDDRYRLPRLRVMSGTSPAALLAQIASAQGDAPPPSSYAGPGIA
jgi:peptidoglycan/xylan/chitin deacetylase (PgdA/CDA1 family)